MKRISSITFFIFSLIAGSAYAVGPDQCAAAFHVVSKAYSQQGNDQMADAANRFSMESFKIVEKMIGPDGATRQVKGFIPIYQRQVNTHGISSMNGQIQQCVQFLKDRGVK